MSESVDQQKIDAHIKQYLEGTFIDLSGYISYKPGEKESHKERKIFLTYGEILYPSVKKLIDNISWSKDDVFCDLGSGIGKVVFQFFMQTPVKKALGIEFNKIRNDRALEAFSTLKKELPEVFYNDRKMVFVEGDFLKQDLSDVTVLYICATCFSPELMHDIGEKLKENAPKLRYLLTLKQIPNSPLPEMGQIDIDCTWKKTVCYVYGEGTLPDIEPIVKKDTDDSSQK